MKPMFRNTRNDAADVPPRKARGDSAETGADARGGGDSASAPDADVDPAEAIEPVGGASEVEIARLRRENEENLQNWKRATADYQNLRRRVQADIDAASQRSKQALLLDFLLVLDYLDMALKAPCTTTEGKNLHAGVELTRSALLRSLDRENVRPMPETGRFDASSHQAVDRVETSDEEEGAIVETVRRGYTCNGQVLRPAQVRVAVRPSSGRARSAAAGADASSDLSADARDSSTPEPD
jgi:molecular chaperone GrpE